MKKKKKFKILCALVCFLCVIGFFGYKYITNRNNFSINQIDFDGNAKFWTDNSMYDTYNISFQKLDGEDIKEIVSKKPNYDMNIKSDVSKGNLDIKIYNDKKILFENNVPSKKTISISNEEKKHLKIKLKGTNAKGHVKINFS